METSNDNKSLKSTKSKKQDKTITEESKLHSIKKEKTEEFESSLLLNNSNLKSIPNISFSDNSKLIKEIKDVSKQKKSTKDSEVSLIDNLSSKQSKNFFDPKEKYEKNLVSLQKKIKINYKKDGRYLRKSTQQVITNLYSFDFEKVKIDQIFLFSIKVEDCKGKENPHYGLIKRLS